MRSEKSSRPTRKKRATLESDDAGCRPMTPRRSASLDALRLRADVLDRVRAFFRGRGLLEVETPALSPYAVSDPALESIAADTRRLGRVHYLHTSPESAMKRLLASGSGDIFQICRVFRDDELGRWHQPEFTLLEWYRVGWDELELMDEVETLLQVLLPASDWTWPAQRLRYTDACRAILGVGAEADAPCLERRLRALEIDVPAALDRDALLDLAMSTRIVPSFRPRQPTFVHDYPVSQAALARLTTGTPPAAARFEVFVSGLELANGFAELTDPQEQRRRFEADQQRRQRHTLPIRPLDEALLEALHTLPPCAGVAVGLDRIVALAAGAASLDEVLSFAH
jgi:elongation factor P--(R)-beta-lysine ligase